jgi:hypothetical protein
MTKAISTLMVAVAVVIAIGAVAPRITQVLGELPLVIVLVTVCVGLLRCLWFYTR